VPSPEKLIKHSNADWATFANHKFQTHLETNSNLNGTEDNIDAKGCEESLNVLSSSSTKCVCWFHSLIRDRNSIVIFESVNLNNCTISLNEVVAAAASIVICNPFKQVIGPSEDFTLCCHQIGEAFSNQK